MQSWLKSNSPSIAGPKQTLDIHRKNWRKSSRLVARVSLTHNPSELWRKARQSTAARIRLFCLPCCSSSTISRPISQLAMTWVVFTVRATLERADSRICRIRSYTGAFFVPVRYVDFFFTVLSPHPSIENNMSMLVFPAYRPRSRTINRPRAGQAGVLRVHNPLKFHA